ncbi:hypothetical protein M8818_003991 [Zalaria obscura]|uniref:Uncharacterized protein n=1 Tax=Zalaria obscura TaxID=2024903 RepID=A0ACC3SDW7_9PEZI
MKSLPSRVLHRVVCLCVHVLHPPIPGFYRRECKLSSAWKQDLEDETDLPEYAALSGLLRLTERHRPQGSFRPKTSSLASKRSRKMAPERSPKNAELDPVTPEHLPSKHTGEPSLELRGLQGLRALYASTSQARLLRSGYSLGRFARRSVCHSFR